jgi:hypothetical protein
MKKVLELFRRNWKKNQEKLEKEFNENYFFLKIKFF